MTRQRDQILVIKHGAFGDLVQSMGPIRAIRDHHPGACVTLLTTAPFADFMRACPYIDHVWIDPRPRFLEMKGILSLRKRLRAERFSRVYDLQNSDRSCFYFFLILPGPRPEWVGTAYGASHRNTSPTRTAGRAFDGHVQTLALAGITNVTVDPLDWVPADLRPLDLPDRFVLMVPGSSPQNPGKRWPTNRYKDLAHRLGNDGYSVVVVGSPAEQPLGDVISKAGPHVLNLCGKTAMTDLPALARQAYAAIGNDTGPMHVFGVTGCPILTLFDTRYSTPHRHQPLGAASHALDTCDLNELSVDLVFESLVKIVRSSRA